MTQHPQIYQFDPEQQEFPTSLLRLFQFALRINSDEDLVAISQPLRLRFVGGGHIMLTQKFAKTLN